MGGRKPKMTAAKVRLAQAAMANRDTSAQKLCGELGVSRATLYRHVTATGELTVVGNRVLVRRHVEGK